MRLEESLFELLAESENLKQLLAVYEGRPAVFYMKPPEDTDSGWEENKYPRVIFYPDLYEDSDKKTAGILELDIEVKDQEVHLREIELAVSHGLENTFIQTEEGRVYAFRRNNNEAMRRRQRGENFSSLLYEILEFPSSEAYNPDPVAALETFHLECLPGFILGKKDEPFYRVKANEPAYYFRLENVTKEEETFSVIWMEGEIGVHIFAFSREETLKWLAYMNHALAERGYLEMSDGSPMRLVKIQGNYTKDILTNGQITLSVRFGILKQSESSPVIQNVYFNESR